MIVDEEVSSLLNRALMMRLIYKSAMATALLTLCSLSFAYVLPATFIGRVLGERGLSTRFDAIEFTFKAERDDAQTFTAKLSKSGQLELHRGEDFSEGTPADAVLTFKDDAISASGKFDSLPGNDKLWSVLLLSYLTDEDSDAVEARWNAIAKAVGLESAKSGLSRWGGTICYRLHNPDAPGSAELLVERKSFQIVEWSPAKGSEPESKRETLRLLDYENSPAPKWLPLTFEFAAPDGSKERYEVLDVKFHKPAETGSP